MNGAKRIAIIGGGIAGLSAAYHIDRRLRGTGLAFECRLLEEADRLGGVIRTERVEGFLLDTGPDSLFRGKPAAIDLAREIGLGPELLDARTQERPTLIYSRGRLRPLPPGLEMLAPARVLPFLASGLISPLGKTRMMMEPFVKTRRDGGDESVAAFVRRRFGDEATRKIAGPLLAGIHAGDPERLSIWSTFPRLAEMERDHGSLAVAMRRKRAPIDSAGPTGAHGKVAPPFVSFKGGIVRMVEGLAASVGAVSLETGCGVAGLERVQGKYRVHLAGRDPWEADACLVALPAGRAAALLDATASPVAAALRKVRYASSATVFLGYRASETGPLPASTGFLIPFSERRRIFGCTFVSNKFEGRAPDGHVLIRAFVGGAIDEASADLPEAQMAAMVRAELRDLIGLRGEPVVTRICRWPKANPQYEVGHRLVVEEIDRRLGGLPGLFVTGSAFRGVGIPDGVTSGARAAGAILSYLGAQ